MNFWGVEVKSGKPVTVNPGNGNIIQISQATLNVKGKQGISVVLSVKVVGNEFVIGTLEQEKCPRVSFDLVYDIEFEISHNLDKESVHFIGYKCPNNRKEKGDGNAGASVSNVVKVNSEDESDDDSESKTEKKKGGQSSSGGGSNNK